MDCLDLGVQRHTRVARQEVVVETVGFRSRYPIRVSEHLTLPDENLNREAHCDFHLMHSRLSRCPEGFGCR